MASPSANLWPVERLLRHERVILAASLLLLTLLSWIYLFRMAASMTSHSAMAGMDMPGMAMPDMRAWGPSDIVYLFGMWALMMVAMMLPSAAPVILLVLATHRRRGGQGSLFVAACFVAGYLAIWTAFSFGAALAQWVFHRTALLSPQMSASSAYFSAVILLAAGIYQWLPFKDVCLAHCRSPLAFLSAAWREGTVGAFLMGSRHGLFCTGCCWALMALLFVAGVMNLLWVAVIAAFVLVEKLAPRGPWVGRFAGVLLVIWGLGLLLGSL